MKPNTITTITGLVIGDIERNFKDIRDFEQTSAGDLCGVDYQDAATSCELITRAADALRDVLLTAADEANKIDIAAMEAKANYCDPQFVTRREHAAMHGMEGAEEE